MNNVNSSEDSVSLLNALNDFALTVLAPLPNNSYFLSQWYKFKPLLGSDAYDPAKVQAFIASLDVEAPFAPSKKPPLSNRNVPDHPLENSKEYLQLPQGSTPTNGDSLYKGDSSYEGNRKSGNSQNSNSTFTPNSLSGYNTFPDQVHPKEKNSDMAAKPEVQIDQIKVEKVNLKSSDEGHIFQKESSLSLQNSISKEGHPTKPKFASEYGFHHSSSQGNNLEAKPDGLNSKKNSTNFEEKSGPIPRANSEKTLEVDNRLIQREPDNSHIMSPANIIKSLKKEENTAKRQRSLTALEYIANTLKKPYSAVSNYGLYKKFFVSEVNLGPSTFYYSFIISYFLHLLSDHSTSLILSNIYEKVVIGKIRLSFYSNHEMLYESLTTSLKTLVNEKLSRTVPMKALQEIFLEKFYDDVNFREGLVAVVKELLIEYITTLDTKSFMQMFGEINLERLKAIIRSQESEPTEDMISIFPYFVEGDIEIHYIQPDKIEIVLYQQKEHKTYGQPLFPLICAKPSNEIRKKTYHALLVEDQTEAIEEFVSAKTSGHIEKAEMRGTVYMSMDSNSDTNSEGEIIKKVEGPNFGSNSKKDDKGANASHKKPKAKVQINRDFLLTKINDLVGFMGKHSDRLASFSKKTNHTETYEKNLASQPFEMAPINSRRKQQGAPQPQQHIVANPNISQRPSSTLHSGGSRHIAPQGYNSNSSSSKHYNLHIDTFLGRVRNSKDSRNTTTTNTSKNHDYTSLSPSRYNRISSNNSSAKADRFQSTKDFIKNAFPFKNDSTFKEASLDNKKGKDGLSTISAISKAGGPYLNKAYSAGLPGLNSRHAQPPSKKMPLDPSPSKSGKKERDREKENFNLTSASIKSPPQKPGLSYYQREAALARAEKEGSALGIVDERSPQGLVKLKLDTDSY